MRPVGAAGARLEEPAASLTLITNTPRDYAWGTPGGISRLLGYPATAVPEAELWFGAHPGSPSRTVRVDAEWGDLAEWERITDQRLPFLLKVLSAATPLSLQAHPTLEQARAGYAREEAAGVPVDAAERNYRDPFAKPELILAVEDGFEALCGFREPSEIIADLDELAALGCGREADQWRSLLTGTDPLRQATAWLLSPDASVRTLIAALVDVAGRYPERFELLGRLADAYPGDPGIAVALMTNHVTLRAGEALWLPAGNIHAYLRGNGVELMGPSDNVLRGGLTRKHIDIPELQRVADFRAIPLPALSPEPVGPNAVSYRPASLPSGRGVSFQLLLIRGPATIDPDSVAIALCLDGSFRMTSGDAALNLTRGEAAFIDGPSSLTVEGCGQLCIALGTEDLPPTPLHRHSGESREL